MISSCELINKVINNAYALLNYKDKDDIHKQHEFRLKVVREDKNLDESGKDEAERQLCEIYDSDKVLCKEGSTRTCENCNEKCFASSYCEFCIKIYLRKNSKWTSGNTDVDNLIRNCQMIPLKPDMVIEWIPYNNLQNIEYLTKGGISSIYTANWIDGPYNSWDSENQKLKRSGCQNVVLKKLESVGENRKWIEEAKSHLTICSKWMNVVQCYGITKDNDDSYMLVMTKMDTDLRNHLNQKYRELTWEDKFQIIIWIISALCKIHKEDAIHRDLHSGNILYSIHYDYWYISDLGFCGPVSKSSDNTGIYGNLPYIAPEVINGKNTTKASDIYSIAMLMWEISSGQPPFICLEHDYNLALSIVNGLRPTIVSGTPLEYENLMKQCWDADPSKRPDIETLLNMIKETYEKNRDNISDDPSQKTNHNNLLCLPTINHDGFKIDEMMEQQMYNDFRREANFHSKEQYQLCIPQHL